MRCLSAFAVLLGLITLIDNTSGVQAGMVTPSPSVSGAFSISSINYTDGPDASGASLGHFMEIARVLSEWSNPPTDLSGEYTFSISVSGGNFTGFSLDASNFSGDATVGLEIYSDPTFSTIVGSAVSFNGDRAPGFGFVDLSDQSLSTLYVKTSYSLTNGASLIEIQQEFSASSVPEPSSLVIGAFGLACVGWRRVRLPRSHMR